MLHVLISILGWLSAPAMIAEAALRRRREALQAAQQARRDAEKWDQENMTFTEIERQAMRAGTPLWTGEPKSEPVVHPGGRFTGLDI